MFPDKSSSSLQDKDELFGTLGHHSTRKTWHMWYSSFCSTKSEPILTHSQQFLTNFHQNQTCFPILRVHRSHYWQKGPAKSPLSFPRGRSNITMPRCPNTKVFPFPSISYDVLPFSRDMLSRDFVRKMLGV